MPNPTLAAVEDRLHRLYAAGHVTGYGAGRPSCYGGPSCTGCAEAREASHEWDAIQSEFERSRLAGTYLERGDK